MFTYDRTSREGRLYVSDAGWARFFAVRDGNVPDLVLTAGEKAWLVACWKAATT